MVPLIGPTPGNHQNAFFAGTVRPFVRSRRSPLNLQYRQGNIHERMVKQRNMALAPELLETC